MKTFLYVCLTFLFIQNCYTQSYLWEPLGKGFECRYSYRDIRDMAWDRVNDQLIVVGSFSSSGICDTMRSFAFWDGVKWDSLGMAHNLSCHSIGYYNGTIYGSGLIHDDPFINIHHLSTYENGVWDSVVQGPNNTVLDYVENDGILYLGGYFDKCGTDSTSLLCSYDGSEFRGLVPKYDYSSGWYINSLAFYNNELYVAGRFQFSNGVSNFAKWDGTDLVQLDPMFENVVGVSNMYKVITYKNELYLGGYFLTQDGFVGNNILRYDGQHFHDVGGGLNERVIDMEVNKGLLYVMGWFTEAGGNDALYLATWDGEVWTSLNDEAIPEYYGLRDILIEKDELYLSGSMKTIAGDSVLGIAKYKNKLPDRSYIEPTAFIDVYPNPTSGNSIHINKYTNHQMELYLYNSLGQLVGSSKLSKGEFNGQVFSNLVRGIYFIKYEAIDGRTISEKVIVMP